MIANKNSTYFLILVKLNAATYQCNRKTLESKVYVGEVKESVYLTVSTIPGNVFDQNFDYGTV